MSASASKRNGSGYREYSEQDVEVARRIRQLLEASIEALTQSRDTIGAVIAAGVRMR